MSKKFLFMTLTVAIFVFLVEAVSSLGLFFLASRKNLVYAPQVRLTLTSPQKKIVLKILHQEEKYITHHPGLGWSVKPNGSTELYRANSQGIRADHNYPLTPEENKIRILSFGDSFTHGDEVHNNETWQEYLNALDPRLETLNFGVSGYGVDQALLRYLQEGRKFHPQVVLIGFMSEDPTRHGSVYRPFFLPQSDFVLTKPRYKLTGGRLQLIGNPLPAVEDYHQFLTQERQLLRKLGQEDFYFQNQTVPHFADKMAVVRLIKLLFAQYINPKDNIFTQESMYDPDSEIFQVSVAILETFYKSILEDGAIPVIVIIPSTGDLMRLQKHQLKNYQPFLKVFENKKWNYIDITDPFLYDKRNAASFVPLFAPEYHFTALGNQRMAEYIYQYLTEKDLLPKKQTPQVKAE
ncbi:MAG: SGNH/GDSL hydrolase family protein [Candidatus Omnitrophota bacterium]